LAEVRQGFPPCDDAWQTDIKILRASAAATLAHAPLTCSSLPLFNISCCVAGAQFPSTGSPRNQSRRLRTGTSWARMTLPLILARWVILAMLVHIWLMQQLLLCINHDLAAQQTLHVLYIR